MRRASAWLAVVGGLAVAIGARLPWLSFYGGLKILRGTRGLYGQALFVGGLALIVGGIVLAIRPARRWAYGVGAVGAVCAGFALYLTVRLQMAVAHILAHDPMVFVQRGSGLWVVLAGGVVASLAAVRRSRVAGYR